MVNPFRTKPHRAYASVWLGEEKADGFTSEAIRLAKKRSGLLLVGEHLLLDEHAVRLRRILLLRHVHAFLMP